MPWMNRLLESSPRMTFSNVFLGPGLNIRNRTPSAAPLIRFVASARSTRCKTGVFHAVTRAPPSESLAGAEPCSARLRSEEHTSELQSRFDLVCRLLLEKKKQQE